MGNFNGKGWILWWCMGNRQNSYDFIAFIIGSNQYHCTRSVLNAFFLSSQVF
jgi:hypothetical protein